MSSIENAATAQRLSWRINDWLKEAGYPFSRAAIYNEIRRGRIDARKAGDNTLILTSPHDYLESLPKKLGPAVGRGRRKARAA
jgi:hypothetical protein